MKKYSYRDAINYFNRIKQAAGESFSFEKFKDQVKKNIKETTYIRPENTFGFKEELRSTINKSSTDRLMNEYEPSVKHFFELFKKAISTPLNNGDMRIIENEDKLLKLLRSVDFNTDSLYHKIFPDVWKQRSNSWRMSQSGPPGALTERYLPFDWANADIDTFFEMMAKQCASKIIEFDLNKDKDFHVSLLYRGDTHIDPKHKDRYNQWFSADESDDHVLEEVMVAPEEMVLGDEDIEDIEDIKKASNYFSRIKKSMIYR